jgi:nucleoside-diphosphate-sugar epimerase
VRALVTGGAGCVGSELAHALLARGDRVTVYDNFSSGKFEHIAPLLNSSNFALIEGDLLDFDLLQSSLREVDMVWHLAANPDVKFSPTDRTDKDLNQNVLATYYVLESMRRNCVTKLAFTSTSAVYGLSDQQPIPRARRAGPYRCTARQSWRAKASFAHSSICSTCVARFIGWRTLSAPRRGRPAGPFFRILS